MEWNNGLHGKALNIAQTLHNHVRVMAGVRGANTKVKRTVCLNRNIQIFDCHIDGSCVTQAGNTTLETLNNRRLF
jgi:hypothetical protein